MMIKLNVVINLEFQSALLNLTADEIVAAG
jgi:hypothetical protein